MTLVAFLAARWDEQESLGRAAALLVEPDWQFAAPSADQNLPSYIGGAKSHQVIAEVFGAAVADHMQAHDPAYVLADLASKREILAEHAIDIDDDPDQSCCATCYTQSPDDWPCRTALLLAAPFKDHPDFDPSWSTG